jgi:beta-phosphoglucomutase-like phosphatase (HAD superfamily)
LSVFDADLNGTDVPHGKPDRTLFLIAAKALNTPPAECLVVEDASAGIEAARDGGTVGLGIARLGDEALLHAADADLVVTASIRSIRTSLPMACCGSDPIRRHRFMHDAPYS